jgi:hypothetical protein
MPTCKECGDREANCGPFCLDYQKHRLAVVMRDEPETGVVKCSGAWWLRTDEAVLTAPSRTGPCSTCELDGGATRPPPFMIGTDFGTETVNEDALLHGSPRALVRAAFGAGNKFFRLALPINATRRRLRSLVFGEGWVGSTPRREQTHRGVLGSVEVEGWRLVHAGGDFAAVTTTGFMTAQSSDRRGI